MGGWGCMGTPDTKLIYKWLEKGGGECLLCLSFFLPVLSFSLRVQCKIRNNIEHHIL